MSKSKSLDIQQDERREVFQAAVTALENGEDKEQAFEQLFGYFEMAQKQATDEVRAMVEMNDSKIVQARGVRVQTSEEREYFQKVIDALQTGAELTGLGVTIPTTVIDTVFENLVQEYPLLGYVDMMFVKENVRLVYNKLGPKEASWGALCATINEQITPALGAIEAGKYALSAYIYMCKDMLKLGAEWLDRYVRTILTDALAAGLEKGIVNGTGSNQPIGMLYDLATYKSDGSLAAKDPVALTSLSIESLGAVIDILKTDEAGRRRNVGVPFFAYSVLDEAKVLAARKVLGPYGYIDVVPYEMDFVPVASLAQGTAILGIKNQYLVTVAGNPDGELAYSDEYKFLEKDRTYTINLLANGIPKDDNAFVPLNITNLASFLPLGAGGFDPDHVWKVKFVQEAADDPLKVEIEGAVAIENADESVLEVLVTNDEEAAIPTIDMTPSEEV